MGGGLREFFVLSMLIAGIGYITFFYLMTFKPAENVPHGQDFLVSYVPSILCGIFLTASATWMPLTVSYLNTQRELWWILAVTSLWITAVTLLAMTFFISKPDIGLNGIHRYISLSGLIYISFHCSVLDAVIWVSKFPRIH